jgi:hypothetical protein
MRIPINILPQSIIDQYNLLDLVHNGFVYAEITKGMYGLPQSGRIANDALVPHLAAHGYKQSKRTPGLFTHDTRPVAFSLVVDDFGIKYEGKEHALHLQQVLQQKYTITTDWEGKQYCGITLDWDYDNGTVDLSMPNYVEQALQRFQHTQTQVEHAPHNWTAPAYGTPIQYTPEPDTSPALDPNGILRLQQVVGVLLYYARAIDSTMLVALGTIASAQSNGTEATAEATTKLLNYAATHPDATIRYNASDMVAHCHSDASYLSEPNSRSRAGGLYFLSSHPDKLDGKPPPLNGAILILSEIMRNVMASAAEAEVGATFRCGQEGCPIRTTLQELGHPQPATPIQTDNKCAEGIINGTVKQRRSKAIDMRFYWIQDRAAQGQFLIHWKPGIENLADYFTKHHAPAHHQRMRPIYLHVPDNSTTTVTPQLSNG